VSGAGDDPGVRRAGENQAAEDRGVITVRPARPGDVPAMVELVRVLAEYERSLDEVEVQPPQLAAALFGEAPQVFAHVAEMEDTIIGMAVWFVNYSTWTGRHGIYLEDLVVVPSARGGGAGRALLTGLAQVAVARGYTRVEWAVIDWNEPAIGFYRHLGALPQDDWTVYRLAGSRLTELAGDEIEGGIDL
jgi:GNAT superfamily N-acetyltransferase